MGLAVGRLHAATNAADNLRTGWYADQPTLTPSLVSGGTFGQIFVTQLDGQIYAQPLFAGNVLFVATETNWIYGLDPDSGAIVWSRNVGAPWNPQDLTCGDLAPWIGITGTPVIDETSGTAYFASKGYASGSSGPATWKLHAVDIATGAERTGFPVTIQGNAQNNPAQAFDPTQQMQRPGLLLMDGVVYVAFGAHCDRGPYQGWVFGVSTAGQIKARWVALGGLDLMGAGIWQSGGGLVSDGPGRILFSTGNGHAPSTPISGNLPPANLGECVVRLQVQPDGSLRAASFFAPFDAFNLDDWDADVGSGGPMALPSTYFGTPAHPNLLVQVGKQGYVYLLDRDALGGMQQGPGGGDAVVSRIGPYGGVWSRPSVWPAEGGWVIVPTSSGGATGDSGYLRFYRYGLDGNGQPTLSLAASSTDAFGFSASSAVVTSDGTTPGSALVWVIWTGDGSGLGGELRCYDAVPVNGAPALRWSASVGRASKFAPPGVGPNGRIYVGNRDGQILGFGAPTMSALTGSTLTFPATTIGQTTTRNDVLTAQGTVTVTALSTSNPQFTLGTPTPPLPAALVPGQTLTVPVTFVPTQAGLVSGDLVVTHSEGTQRFGLQGTGQLQGAHLTATPVAVSFGGTTVGGQLTSVVTFANQGSAPLTVTGETLPAPPFGASGMPPIGYVMNPGNSVGVSVSFNPTSEGYFTDSLTMVSTGGTSTVPLSGSAQPPGILQVSPLSLTWGDVAVGSSATMSFTVGNVGSSNVTITKSKPPIGGQFVNLTYLFEGTSLAPGQEVTETVQLSPGKLGYLTDSWTINSDASTGLQTVRFNGNGTIPDPGDGGWTLNGTASLAGTAPNRRLVLTPPQEGIAGSSFWPGAVDPSNLDISFDATIDSGDGADGMTFVLSDPSQGATPADLGYEAGGLGFSLIPGIAVALDTYRNSVDPSNNFVGVTDGPIASSVGALHWLQTTTNVPPLRPATHRVGVRVNAGLLDVSMDGAPLMSVPIAVPNPAFVGFTGATGGLVDQHAVSHVTIRGYDPAPSLTGTPNRVAGTVHLQWTGGAAPFTLERAEDPGFSVGVVTLSTGTSRSYDDPTLRDGRTYYYRVR